MESVCINTEAMQKISSERFVKEYSGWLNEELFLSELIENAESATAVDEGRRSIWEGKSISGV